jgi:microcompartment protein CcmL/EutN
MPDEIQALGIMESFSLATMVIAADAILKAADLQPLELRLGNGLGGKSFFTFTGDVGAVETGIEIGKAIAEEKGLLVNAEIIASPSDRLLSSLF